MQHYSKLMNFYSELNVVETLENSINAVSIDDKQNFYTDLYHKFNLKLPQLRMINSETNLFESDEIVSVNKELFTRFGNLLNAIRFNNSEGEIYSLLVKVWEIEIATDTTNKYKDSINLLRK